jgi:sorting nexin-8
MSLFGDEPSPAAAAKSRTSLFDDDDPSPAPGSKSSLFADEDDAPSSSPWAMPTPKKATRGELMRSLLPSSDVPDSYHDIFDSVLQEDSQSGGKVTSAGVAKLLSATKLGADEQSQIMNIISSGGQLADLGKNEFNVLLALIGLAQEHEDITLDGIDDRRRGSYFLAKSYDKDHQKANDPLDLPIPILSTSTVAFVGVSELAAKPPQRPTTPPSAPATVSVSTPIPKREQKGSLEFPEPDPWGSPALHRGHGHEAGTPKTNGSRETGNRAPEPVRTTSSFTTGSGASNAKSARISQETPSTPAWDSYDGATRGSFSNSGDSTIGGGGFGGSADDGQQIAPAPAVRSIGGGRIANEGPEEMVLINLIPEKEGIFMMKHHNYQVTSTRRGIKVVRRYSDFVWLLECLQKRYPFRQIPLLPPKRVGGMLTYYFWI